jgi:hypothetical protein
VGAVLPLVTSVIDGEQLTATVSAAQVSSAGQVQVSVRSPAPGAFVSNQLPFVIEAPAPLITNLTPATAGAGSATLLLTVNGSNFAADSQVLWNGVALATQFVSAGQLNVQIDASPAGVGADGGRCGAKSITGAEDLFSAAIRRRSARPAGLPAAGESLMHRGELH